jgi:hypothetical protein
MSLKAIIRAWYRGKLLPPRPGIVELDRYQQPPLAEGLGIIGRFYLAHWQWIIGTAVAIMLTVIRI